MTRHSRESDDGTFFSGLQRRNKRSQPKSRVNRLSCYYLVRSNDERRKRKLFFTEIVNYDACALLGNRWRNFISCISFPVLCFILFFKITNRAKRSVLSLFLFILAKKTNTCRSFKISFRFDLIIEIRGSTRHLAVTFVTRTTEMFGPTWQQSTTRAFSKFK